MECQSQFFTRLRPSGRVAVGNSIVARAGTSVVGKTHLAVALAVKAAQAGVTICFTSMADLIDRLKLDHAAGKTGRLRGYYKASLVVVDEVGYTPITQDECNLFYRFVAARYEKSSTVITSNKAFSDWQEMFHDAVIVTAILDRLLHHSTVINIKGHSYRLKGKLGEEGESEEAQKPKSTTSEASPPDPQPPHHASGPMGGATT